MNKTILISKKKKELIVGLNLFKPNYLQDKFEDHLCKKILELKGDEIDLKVITGSIRMQKYGLSSFENITKKKKFLINKKRLAQPIMKARYSNSYLHQVSQLMCQSKSVSNYFYERRNISIQNNNNTNNSTSHNNKNMSTFSSPMISSSHFYSSTNDFYQTRNTLLSPPTKSSKVTIHSKKYEPKSVQYSQKVVSHYKANGNSNSKANDHDDNAEGEGDELQLILPQDDEYFRFDDRLSHLPARIIDRLKLENKFYKDKHSLFSDSFTKKKEALFRNKDPLDKSKYLRKEYFNKRSSYIRTAHRIDLRTPKDKANVKGNDVYNSNSNKNNHYEYSKCNRMLRTKSKNMLEFGIND